MKSESKKGKRNTQELTKIGIYARKSKFTGKGESIDNQIKICKEYVRTHLVQDKKKENIQIEVYKDEGISGKDIESRPEMLRLVSDVEKGKIQVVVCYRLDRISRSVKDFSGLLTKLEDYGTGFISVNESFDTRTPMGRAMMYIASVFAQLERETIAERIADNMYALAKTGRWLGGMTPLGFDSVKVESIDEAGRKISRYQLEAKREEAEIVKLIYYKYLELGSLTKLETYLMNNNYHTRSKKLYGRYTLKAILTNPVYCVADEDIYNYLLENGFGIYTEHVMFDGSRGLIAYNKFNCKPKEQRINNAKDWIIAVGGHEGIINSETWIKVQKRISSNSEKGYRYPKTIGALLSGIVRCGNCGSFMRPKGGRKTTNGEKRYYYQCECKEKSRGNLCQMPNISGNTLDRLVIKEILNLKEEIVTEYTYIQEAIQAMENTSYIKEEKNIILKQIGDCEKQIEKLLDVLALGKESSQSATEAILKRIEETTVLKNRLKEQYNNENKNKEQSVVPFDCEFLAQNLVHLNYETWEQINPARQKDILKTVIREIIWDGKYAVIHLWAEKEPGAKPKGDKCAKPQNFK